MTKIERVIKESKKCEESSESRKAVMLEFLNEYVSKNGQTQSAKFLGIARESLNRILTGKRGIGEKLLRDSCEKILND